MGELEEVKTVTEAREKAVQCYRLDQDGFLSAHQGWDEAVAAFLAHQDGLELSETHWQIIRYFRQYFVQTKTIPSMRDLRNKTGLSVSELFRLFPAGGPLMQGVKIAGLPKPSGCK